MDALITYVNGLDPLWREDYAKVSREPALVKRYRDWGTMKYLFRGIEKHMPFIDRIFLLVARDSQVPSWVNRDTVRVVLHEEIIPGEHLPTFNSSMIEMFLHRIPDISEKYLYFNDDMFPVAKCSEEDFFDGDVSKIGFSKTFLAGSAFKRLARDSDHLARKALGMGKGLYFIRPQHTCSPMQKSLCEEVYSKVEPDIIRSLSPFREKGNFNQYLFLDYMYYKGRARSEKIPAKYNSLAVATTERIRGLMLNPGRYKLICINDVSLDEEKFRRYREQITAAFEEAFPERSRFEISAP